MTEILVVKILRKGRDNSRYLLSTGDTMIFDNDQDLQVGDRVKFNCSKDIETQSCMVRLVNQYDRKPQLLAPCI